MHPKEADRLRKLYGNQLFTIALFSPEEVRSAHLAKLLAGGNPVRIPDMKPLAEELIQSESGRLAANEKVGGDSVPKQFRNNIPSTWRHADLFLDASETDRLGEQIERLIQLIFGHPFRTPRAEEIGMGEAFAAALESGNLARPVGASIISANEEVVSIGTNEVPQPGGGVYRAGATPDHRDHTEEWLRDSSDEHRRGILLDFFEHLLADPAWLRKLDRIGDGSDHAEKLVSEIQGCRHRDIRSAVTEITKTVIDSDVVWDSELFDVIEYSRTLHAEMDAITSAARKSVSTRGATLYCTTMPCHECARLIIGAGIKRIVFVEPYDKSRAMLLYKTELKLSTMVKSVGSDDDNMVHVIPYIGLSPRRFGELFSWVPRKQDDTRADDDLRELQGRLADWDPRTAPIRESIVSASAFGSLSRSIDLLLHERHALDEYDELVRGKGQRSTTG
jgi:cytidine deaminase